MKIIKDYEQLVGKTIAFAHMAQFADQITLATTDGDVLMAEFELVGEDDMEIKILRDRRVIQRVEQSKHLQKALSELGIWDLSAYLKQQEERTKILKEQHLKEKEIRERKTLAELKAKYEEVTS